MALVLGTYRPDVQCGGAFSSWASCRSIVGDMPTLTATEVFGPVGNPAVQVSLPRFLEAGQCSALSFAASRLSLTTDVRR